MTATATADADLAEDRAAAQPPVAGPFRRRIVTFLMIGVGLIGVAVVLYAWRLPPFVSTIETTENAYVRGQVTTISPQVSGYAAQVPVQDYQAVRAGQVLARIDDRVFRQRVAQAQAAVAAQEGTLANAVQQRRSAEAGVGQTDARIASARAALARAQAEANRTRTLRKAGWVAQAQLDTAEAALGQARAAVAETQAGRTAAEQGVTSAVVGRESLAANVAAAQANLRLAEIDLANTAILAPRDGRLGEVGVRQGQYVTAGTQLMSLVPAGSG